MFYYHITKIPNTCTHVAHTNVYKLWPFVRPVVTYTYRINLYGNVFVICKMFAKFYRFIKPKTNVTSDFQGYASSSRANHYWIHVIINLASFLK